MEKEIWKEIKGYEGLYKVSNYGKVKRLIGYHCRQERYVSSHINHDGYLRVSLSKDGKAKIHEVSRLVCFAFCPPPQNWKQDEVNHKDGLKQNNYFENLEWCSRTENSWHAHNILNKQNGENGSKAILTREQVNEIRKLLNEGKHTQCELARRFNIHQTVISRIKLNQTWK